jgi:ADP-ribose pyrophosphatase YjhB (NUDIX family)
MKFSAGIIIKYKNKILLCHPSDKSWTNTFTPPKGGINFGESEKQAAIRETFEEVGITIHPGLLVHDPVLIEYTSDKQKIYKKVYLFKLEISELSQIGLIDEVVPKEQLQTEEIDWAGFMTKEEATEKLFWRYSQIWDLF